MSPDSSEEADRPTVLDPRRPCSSEEAFHTVAPTVLVPRDQANGARYKGVTLVPARRLGRPHLVSRVRGS